jgi:glucose/arabinose dehydrogenase
VRFVLRACAGASVLAVVAGACSDPVESATSTAEAGAAGAPPEAAGAPGTAPSNELRVDFEEVELEGEPSFVTDFAFYPDSSNDFLTLSKDGRLRRYRLDGDSAALRATWVVAGVHDEQDCGALSLAFEPDLEQHAYLYVGTCVSNSGSQILRLSLDAAGSVIEGSELSIMYVGHELATRAWHNVGSLGFEPGGVMWALFGDKAQRGTARDLSTNLGKLVRIVPSRKPELGGYEPAPDNPRLPASANPDVYALGLRSPFRGTRDSRGFYWIGDVGGDLFEEVNLAAGPGMDFGWADFEGPCTDCSTATSPLLYWPQTADAAYVLDDPDTESTSARVAWAGPEVVAHEPDRYDGRLAGSVLFGDYCAGFVRHGRVDDTGALTLDAPLGHLKNAAAFRQHADGYVYAVTFGRCEVSKDNAGDEPFSRLFRMIPKD